LAGSRLRRQPLAVMFLDLDRFKLINDTLGHTAGDRLLQMVAKRLTGGLREVDTIARTGGDEFTVIVSEIEGAADAAKVAERILSAFLRPFVVERQELFVTASVGISLFPSDGADVETLVKNADTAMYRAKEQGRNNFQFFTKEMSAAALSRMRMEHRLRRAVEGSEFVLHYQPRVDIGLEAVLGAEALLRWQQPELGLVQPLEFIGLAEETGLIIPITEWVLRTACGQNKAWQDEGIPAMTVDVNIAARQLQQHDLPAVIQEALDVTGLAPEHLGLEMTESALMGNPEVAARVLRKLRDMGVRLFVDDFGTGHSSLSHLKQFPVDAVKIDRSFVSNVTTNPDDAAIASAIVAMAHSLKLRVIAEGVETEEQLAFLRGLGCDEVQGFLVRRPVPAEEFGRHLRSPLKELAAR